MSDNQQDDIEQQQTQTCELQPRDTPPTPPSPEDPDTGENVLLLSARRSVSLRISSLPFSLCPLW